MSRKSFVYNRAKIEELQDTLGILDALTTKLEELTADPDSKPWGHGRQLVLDYEETLGDVETHFNALLSFEAMADPKDRLLSETLLAESEESAIKLELTVGDAKEPTADEEDGSEEDD